MLSGVVMRADIPKDLKTLVERDADWTAIMLDSFGVVENQSLIIAEAPHFFPEYTEHGCRHVIDVLATAWTLVADECRTQGFSPADGAALALAVLLHDLAMHMSEAGLLSLIADDSAWKPLAGWKKDKPWGELWDDFLAEARRFDSAKRLALFGKTDWNFRIPPLGEGGMSKDDRLLVGEFLRRHHPRLAHEIARYGFPAADGKAITVLSERLGETERDIIGIIARSHGLNLRTAMDHLAEDDQFRDWNDMHPVYLMALLRVGDYLRLQADRAPAGRLRLAPLLSPVSAREQEAHRAITAVKPKGAADPECLTITAKPTNVRTHTKIMTWLRGIQAELDQSWAVLGEVYGRYADVLPHPALSIRRIKSNLDDAEGFADSVDYIPQPITFTTAGGPLLKLLVGPLYRERPQFGLRELMQNAVDAVRERYDLCEKHPHLPDQPPAKGSVDDVVISIDLDDTGKPVSVTCTDRGIGMSLDTLRDYFLKAGASLRTNPQWRRQHADDDNQVTIPRTGRFGIGVLAAFLIGNKITVTTRHQKADIGYRFSTTLDEEIIKITKVPGAAIGTTIVVSEVKNVGLSDRTWDFYCGTWPRVVRKAGNDLLSQLRHSMDGEAGVWSLQSSDFPEIQVHVDGGSGLICNDIWVGESHGTVSAPLPALLVVRDPNSLLPLSLNRTGLTETPSFAPALAHLLVRDALARLLACPQDPALLLNMSSSSWLYRLADGWTIHDLAIFRQKNITRLLVRGRRSPRMQNEWRTFPPVPPGMAATDVAIHDAPDTFFCLNVLDRWSTKGHGFAVNDTGQWRPGNHPRRLTLEWEASYLSPRIVEPERYPDGPQCDLEQMIKEFSEPGILCEFIPKPFNNGHAPAWAPLWHQLVPGGVFPFDPAAAREVLAAQFADPQFVRMVEYYEKLAADRGL